MNESEYDRRTRYQSAYRGLVAYDTRAQNLSSLRSRGYTMDTALLKTLAGTGKPTGAKTNKRVTSTTETRYGPRTCLTLTLPPDKGTKPPDAAQVARPVRRGAGGKGQKDLARMPTILLRRCGFQQRLSASVRPLHKGPLHLLIFSIPCNSRCATMPCESKVCLSISERAYGQEARGKQSIQEETTAAREGIRQRSLETHAGVWQAQGEIHCRCPRRPGLRSISLICPNR